MTTDDHSNLNEGIDQSRRWRQTHSERRSERRQRVLCQPTFDHTAKKRIFVHHFYLVKLSGEDENDEVSNFFTQSRDE